MDVAGRIFVDTEFKNLPWTGHSDLLWIGLADEAGNSWSAINDDVRIDEHASEFTRNVVLPRMSADEPRLSRRELEAEIRRFCGSPDEFWAWCPTVEVLSKIFGLGPDAPAAFERYWDWDFQLLRRVVDPWPAGWPAQLCNLSTAARNAGIAVPRNDSPHHPRDDALWARRVFQLVAAATRP